MHSDNDELILMKDDDKIYASDFEQGRYISKTFTSDELPPEGVFKISPKIDVRLTYIKDKDDIRGIQITKIAFGKEKEQIALSAFDFRQLLATLKLFSGIDLKSVANRTILFDESIFSGNDSEKLKKFLTTMAIDPKGKEILASIDNLTPSSLQVNLMRERAYHQFERLLNDGDYFKQAKCQLHIGKDEEVWQKFFTKNDWILGSNVIEVLGSRVLDEHNITDIPFKSYDGFLDIIELKLPTAPFWTKELAPQSDLTKAIMQCANYLRAAEQEADSLKRQRELGCTIIKPRITLIYGRSADWSDEQKEEFRVLNSTLANISILTYDHVLLRAKNIIGLN